jgi:hypothetical protein
MPNLRHQSKMYVSVTTVHDEINWCIPIMWEQLHALVQWPSLDVVIFEGYSPLNNRVIQWTCVILEVIHRYNHTIP